MLAQFWPSGFHHLIPPQNLYFMRSVIYRSIQGTANNLWVYNLETRSKKRLENPPFSWFIIRTKTHQHSSLPHSHIHSYSDSFPHHPYMTHMLVYKISMHRIHIHVNIYICNFVSILYQNAWTSSTFVFSWQQQLTPPWTTHAECLARAQPHSGSEGS